VINALLTKLSESTDQKRRGREIRQRLPALGPFAMALTSSCIVGPRGVLLESHS